MPIQLPAGAIRTALNLKDNPGNLKQEVILCGNIENYFGATGLKSVAYAKIGVRNLAQNLAVQPLLQILLQQVRVLQVIHTP